MKSFTFAAVAASLLLVVCLFVTGCGSATTGNDKMGMSDGKMSAMDKMGDDKMADGKMHQISEDKMDHGKMGNDKMAGK